MLRNYYKFLLLMPFLFFTLIASATNYYLSNSGNDSNSGTDPSSPWQTINKLNSFKGISSGDNVYFNRGDVFYGGIVINSSGITIDAYGSGANPVITGFTTVNSWSNLGGNIWESNSSVSTLSTCNSVLVNGVNTPMGRYPNSGYLTYESCSGNTSITSNSLSGMDWTGAVAVIKKERYVIDKNPITSQSGSTLYYSNGGSNAEAGWGFFIQNDSRTLDQQNEWYYNPSNGKLRIYSSSTPQNVQLASIDNLLYSAYKNNVTIQNLSFTGANNSAFYIGSCANMEIRNCSTDYCYNGVLGANFGGSSNNFRFENCMLNHSNNNGINLTNEFTNAFVSNNTIQNSGVLLGMFGSGGGTSQGMNISAPSSTVVNNEVDNSGYIGIGFNGNYITIKNNFVNTFCTLKDDGGGIYSGNNATGNVISGNIVINGIGNGDGTLNSSVLRAHGIFLDDNATGVQILDNSIANIAYAAIFLHNAQGITVTGNTTYNANIGMLASNDNSVYTSNLTVQNNKFVGTSSGQMFTPQNQISLQFSTIHNNLSSFGNVDNNYYARPIDDNKTLIGTLTGVADNILGLSGWQSFTGFDTHSAQSPKAITDASDMRFEYNASSSNKSISLGAAYIDITGKTTYNGSISLAPYTSVVLIKTGNSTNVGPTANAGSDQTITLPSNSVSLNGSGSDPDGTISSYAWTQTSGPSGANISSTSSPSPIINGLVEGTYVFQLQVTDNNGATGVATVQVKVINQTISSNIALPVAYAGGNGTITLPTNSVSLNGSGTSSSGSITSYNWSVISGPSTVNFSNSNAAATTASGLTQGTYIFQLKVIDNNGTAATSTVQINVINPSSNIPPVANAGGNGTITLPTNSVRLDGTGTDSDGTITSYNWTQISGPAAAIITDPNSASTTVQGMIVGTYFFQLQVTDDQGATGTSTVQVNVANPPASINIAPTANAGGNGTVTLPINSVRLDGIGTDADGTITGYKWSQISGPAQGSFTSPNSASTKVNGLVLGSYVFQLQVTDNNGAIGTSTVKINVVNPINIAPVAYAGGNGTITLPVNVVLLTGTGSDADGNITAYNWSQVSGPSSGNITSPNSARTTVTDLVPGDYVFQFQVTDNQGALGTSTVLIRVVNPVASRMMSPATETTSASSVDSTSKLSVQQADVNSVSLSTLDLNVFPNPFQNYLNITINGPAGKYNLILTDAQGKTVLTKTGQKDNGTTQLFWNSLNFESGIYFLRIQQNNNSSTIKLVKQ